ncbi:MAG: DUF1223 domain-containing protein [Methylocella sp.]
MVVVACCNLGAGPFASRTINHVVELFTSQGCAGRPRAGRWLAAIARARRRGGFLSGRLLGHYRLAGCARASGLHGAPEGLCGGARRGECLYPATYCEWADAAGGDPAEIEQAIKTAKGVEGALAAPMRLSETGGHFMVEVAGGSGGPAAVFVPRVARASTVDIQLGENAGRAVTYANVVRSIDKLGDWIGQTATFGVPGVARDGKGFVVLVQKGTPERQGAILAAAKTEGL